MYEDKKHYIYQTRKERKKRKIYLWRIDVQFAYIKESGKFKHPTIF